MTLSAPGAFVTGAGPFGQQNLEWHDQLRALDRAGLLDPTASDVETSVRQGDDLESGP